MGKIHYDYSEVDGYNAPITLVVAERGIGKTFGKKRKVIEKCIVKALRFVYVVLTDVEVKKLTMNSGEKFFADVLEVYAKKESSRDRYFNNRLISSSVDEEVDSKMFKGTATKISGGTIRINGQTAGYILDLNSFGSLKRNAFVNIDTVIIDEFIAEKFDKTTLDTPRKIVSLIETVVRTKKVKIYMLGNSVRVDDPILSRMGFKLKGYGFYKVYDEFGLLAVLHYVDSNDYPEYKELHRRSIAGRIARLFGEEHENENTFKSDLPDDKRLTTFRYKKNGMSMNIVRDDIIITLRQLQNGKIAVVPFSRYSNVQNLWCLTPKEQGYKMGYHVICNLALKETLQNMLASDILYYYSEVEYLQLKTILKGVS